MPPGRGIWGWIGIANRSRRGRNGRRAEGTPRPLGGRQCAAERFGSIGRLASGASWAGGAPGATLGATFASARGPTTGARRMGRKDGAYRKKGVGREKGRCGRTPARRFVRREGGRAQVWHAARIGVKREFRALDAVDRGQNRLFCISGRIRQRGAAASRRSRCSLPRPRRSRHGSGGQGGILRRRGAVLRRRCPVRGRTTTRPRDDQTTNHARSGRSAQPAGLANVVGVFVSVGNGEIGRNRRRGRWQGIRGW